MGRTELLPLAGSWKGGPKHLTIPLGEAELFVGLFSVFSKGSWCWPEPRVGGREGVTQVTADPNKGVDPQLLSSLTRPPQHNKRVSASTSKPQHQPTPSSENTAASQGSRLAP